MKEKLFQAKNMLETESTKRRTQTEQNKLETGNWRGQTVETVTKGPKRTFPIPKGMSGFHALQPQK